MYFWAWHWTDSDFTVFKNKGAGLYVKYVYCKKNNKKVFSIVKIM